MFLASLERGKSSRESFTEALNILCSGTHYINRNSYPWQEPVHPLLQKVSTIGGAAVVEYHAALHQGILDVYLDHVINGKAIMPAAGYIEIALASVCRYHKIQGGIRLTGFLFFQPMEVSLDSPILKVALDASEAKFQFRSEAYSLYASGEYSYDEPTPNRGCQRLDIKAALREFSDEQDATAVYRILGQSGLRYGPKFQPLSRVWAKGNRALAYLTHHVSLGHYLAHSVMIDGVFQLVAYLNNMDSAGHSKPMVPAFIKHLYSQKRFQKDTGTREAWASVSITGKRGGEVMCLIQFK